MRCMLAMLVLVLGCSSKAEDKPVAKAPVETRDPPAAKPVADREVVVPRLEPRVGDIVTTRLVGETTSGEAGKPPSAMDAKLTKARRLEVTAVEAGVVTGALVTYLEERMDLQSGSKSAAWQPLLRGHTYDVAWKHGALQVARKDGAMSAEETKRVRRDLRALVGQPDFVMRAVSGRPVKSGEAIGLPPELAGALGERAQPSEATVRLIDVRGDVAVFEVHLVYRAEDDGYGFDVKSRSALEVSTATGRAARQTSSSSLAMAAKGAGGGVAFTYTETAEYTYEAAPLPVPP